MNAGSILNQGIETLLKVDAIERNTWGVNFNLNVSHNWGKVEKLNGKDTTIV